MKSQEIDVSITEALNEIRKQNEQIIHSNLESLRLSHPDIEIPQPTNEDEGFWASGYATLKPSGIWVDFQGNFTCKEKGNFHIDGRLYGPFFGGTTKAAFVLCVYNPLVDHFFDTDLASAISITGVSTGITMSWYGAPVALMTGPSFGSVGIGGGTLRAERF